ncbi:hypothetical protein ACK31N_04195 [Aeromonas caviae]
MNKHGLFSLSGLVLALGLSLSTQAAQALRVPRIHCPMRISSAR